MAEVDARARFGGCLAAWPPVTPWAPPWISVVPAASNPSATWSAVAHSVLIPASGPMTRPWPCASPPA